MSNDKEYIQLLTEKRNIERHEKNLKQVPSKADYKHSKKILEDFDITDVDIPEFDSKLELERFIKTTISTHLDNYE